jgi:hypothetical protein
LGKVVGVKVEIHGEKRAGGGHRLHHFFMGLTADELALTLPSPSGEGFLRGPRGAMNGIRREKTRKAQRGKVTIKDFEQERTEKTERENFAENALCLDIALQNSRNFDLGSGQDEFGRRGRRNNIRVGPHFAVSAALPTDARRHFMGYRHGQNDWQRNRWRTTESPRLGARETIGLLKGYCSPETSSQRGS